MTLVDKLYKRDIEEAYQRGAADARAKLLAEVCAWLLEGATEPDLGDARDRLGRTDIIRLRDAIEAKFKATHRLRRTT